MKTYKIIVASILIAIPGYIALAETINSSNADIIAEINISIERNNKSIEYFKIQNQILQSKLIELSSTWTVEVNSSIWTSSLTWASNSNTWTENLTWVKASSVEKYNILIDKINSLSQNIFSEYKLWTGSSIWLFEFIEPSNFFISIDDWLNPTWITAFKKKILYSYDKNYSLTIDWIFDLDYISQYYVTKFWKNPFAKVTRIRVKNPIYKGKLLDIVGSWTTAGSWTISNTTSTSANNVISTVITPTSSTTTSNVTLADVTSAYNKNKILDAIKLSNEYIKKDPNNLDIIKIRYRSYYLVWKYTEALSEVQKYINIKWENTEKSIYCEAKVIAKLNKSTDLMSTYTNLCSTKK